MAASSCETRQYTSEQFVESAGAILFKVSTRQICLDHARGRDVWLLAKGRRNVGESRASAAIREAKEETGFSATLLPVTMRTRCTPDAQKVGHMLDETRGFENVTEPFMLTRRTLPKDGGIKLIYWYIGAIDENVDRAKGEDQFDAQLFGFDEVLDALTYQLDREIVAKAIEIFKATFDAKEKS